MSQAERLQRLSEILIELFRSPIPTHFFQTLGDHAGSAVPHDYLAVCLEMICVPTSSRPNCRGSS